MKTAAYREGTKLSLLKKGLTVFMLLIASIAAQAQPRLYSWGNNNYLQLGTGTNVSRPIPGNVKAPPSTSALTNITAIHAGDFYTLAVRTDGTVWTWGHNSSGQLGNNTTTPSQKPVQVMGPNGTGFLNNVVNVSASNDHVLAWKSDRTLWAWGWNNLGQIGDNTYTPRRTPVQVVGPNGTGFLTDVISATAGGAHSVAVRGDGTVWCWGDNNNGSLGNNTVTYSPVPIQTLGPNGVSVLTDVVEVTAGEFFTLARKSDGTVWSWGLNNFGQLGDGTTTLRTTPVQVLGPNGTGFLTGVVGIAAGQSHALALRSDGTVWAWGYNGSRQLGDNTATQSLTPVQVHGPGNVGFLTGISSVVAGRNYSMARRSDGTAWSWGDNLVGQLGDNTNTTRGTPVQVVGPNGSGLLADVTMVGAGVHHSVACKSDGTVWCWGYNGNGQLGTDTSTDSKTPIRTVSPEGLNLFTGAKAVVTGPLALHTVVLKPDGTVFTFGYNAFGQLGDGTTADRSIAVQVPGPNGVGFLTDVIAVAAGNNHTVALKSDGTVWAWGQNTYGQLGDNTTTQRLTPVQVHAPDNIGFLNDIAAITAGNGYTLAMNRKGKVFGWGFNGYGQLGTGNFTDYLTPRPMLNVSGTGAILNIVSLAAGSNHTLLLSASGAVFACGQNAFGEVGDGTTTRRNLPVRVLSPDGVGALTSLVSIAAGKDYSVALAFDGTVYAWGNNGYGQLGDNTTTNRSTPVQVKGEGGVGALTEVAILSAGQTHVLAVKFDGTAWGWGDDTQGQLGDNTYVASRPTPIRVLGPEGVGFLNNIITVAAGHAYSVALNGQGAVQGNVILQNAACTDAPINFQFRPANSSPFTRTLLAGPLGLFSFTDIPPGEYDIAIKGSKWLQRTVHVNTTNSNLLNLRVFLLAGDANDDNSIDVLDLDALIRAFDTAIGDPQWNWNADFNCDDSVDVLDLDLLIQNFDLLGDP
jgi:alpha-tubulin suppressor-like RCC1 family protein